MTITTTTALLSEYIASSLAIAHQPPPPLAPTKAKRPATGIWATMNPEERSAYAKELRSRVKPENLSRPNAQRGIPRGWTAETFSAAQTEAAKAAKRLLKDMKRTNATLAADTDQTAILSALTALRQPGTADSKLAAVRSLLKCIRSTELIALAVAS